MFLINDKDLTVPKDLRGHCFFDGKLADNVWGGEKPKHLIPLGQSLWPDEVKNQIVEIFKAIGVADPLRQKLVEPFAIVFGGKHREKESDLSEVNWGMVIDYFTWEAAAMTDPDKSRRLQNKAEKKYGGIFSHYIVYEDYTERR